MKVWHSLSHESFVALKPNSLRFCQLFVLVLVAAASNAAPGDCTPEFKQCAMAADCCEGLNCVEGDWEVTTDYTCLSTASIVANKLPLSDKLGIVKHFYAHIKSQKEDNFIRNLVKRRSGDFAKLIFQLNKKFRQHPVTLWEEAGAGKKDAEEWANEEVRAKEREHRKAETEDRDL
jgi:hypothetical protein